MKIRCILAVSLLLVFFLLLGFSLSAQASPAAQLPQYATPTPGPDGRIIYIVKEGDNCTSIILKNGITEQQLRALNSKLDAKCFVLAGQELLLGLGGPTVFTPTPGPSPTPLPASPTPTPFTGTTEVCVLLFEDLNGDALRQESEVVIPGGAVNLTNTFGSYSQTRDTVAGIDPVCFSDVPEGEYNVSAAIPDGYNPTMELSYTLLVKAGDRAFVDFGAQSKAMTVTNPGNQGGGSPALGILGVALLLAGAGLGWYAVRLRKPKSQWMSGKSFR